MRHLRTAFGALLLAAGLSNVSAQTGSVVVQVADSHGDPLPAATVTITHALGYVKATAVLTNRNGVAEFQVLRPTGGTTEGYTIDIVFPGFAPMQLPDIKVHIGKTTKLPVRLAEEIVERVEVVARTDVINLEDTSQTTRFSDQFIQDLPVPGRFYQNVLTMAAGVQDADGDGNPNVHGSRDRDFKALVSGISNVDPLTGQQMAQINPNSIEEMEVITAGASVEFSRAQGGFARILQKQGSNQFEGVFEFYYRSSVLDGNGAEDRNKTQDPSFDWYQPAFQLSGPIVRDKLWYRLSHEWILRDIPQNTTRGISVITDDQGIHSDQITWQASPRNKLAFQYQADPRKIDNMGVNSMRPEGSALRLDTEAQTYSVNWTSSYSPKILIDSKVAWQDDNIRIGPTQQGLQNNCITGEFYLESAQCFNAQTGEWSGTYWQNWDDHRQRLTVRGDATIFGGQLWGASHQFKIGMIVENERYARELTRRPIISFFLLDPSDPTTGGEVSPELAGVVFGRFSAPEFTQVTAKGITWGLYAEDRIKPVHNLTITLGARLDREEIHSNGRQPFAPGEESANFVSMLGEGYPPQQATQRSFTAFEAQRDFFKELAHTLNVEFHEIFKRQSTMAQESEFWDHTRRIDNLDTSNTNIAPRVSIAWDPWSNGKTKLAATAGRYYDKIYLGIPLIELQPASADLAFDATFGDGAWSVAGLRNSVNPAVNVQTVDRDLKTPYQDEWTLSFERELWAETSAKITYINRKYRDQFQDTDLNHLPGDWGRCVTATLANPYVTVAEMDPSDEDYDPALAPGDGILDDCIGELEIPEGQDDDDDDDGFRDPPEVILQRPDGTADLYLQNPGWGDIYLVGNLNVIDYQAVVLELIRRQYRNWEMRASYTWSEALGDGEDFGQSLGDDLSLVQDEKGYQSYDQRHVVKLNATTITPWGFRLGGAISWQSGLPYSIVERRPAWDAVPPHYQSLGAGGSARSRTVYPTGQRNDQRNDSYWNVDVKVSKEFNLANRVNLQVSAEIFNLLNDGTYMIYDPLSQSGAQVNGINGAVRRFGRRWQIGMKLAF
jgi:hypothetical protein